jgi:hypothetical protein
MHSAKRGSIGILLSWKITLLFTGSFAASQRDQTPYVKGFAVAEQLSRKLERTGAAAVDPGNRAGGCSGGVEGLLPQFDRRCGAQGE